MLFPIGNQYIFIDLSKETCHTRPLGVTRAPFVNFGKGLEQRASGNELAEAQNELKISEIWLLSTAGNQYASSDISKETVSHAPPVATRAQFEPRAFGN